MDTWIDECLVCDGTETSENSQGDPIPCPWCKKTKDEYEDSRYTSHGQEA